MSHHESPKIAVKFAHATAELSMDLIKRLSDGVKETEEAANDAGSDIVSAT